MAQQKINYGAAPNDGTGDLYRVAMIKIDNNFTDLYTNKVDKTVTIALSGGATGTATTLSGAAVVIPVTGLNMGNATAGTLAVARGGTGVTTSTGTGANVQAVSPALTGTPTVPTAADTANSTQIASTAFVRASTVKNGMLDIFGSAVDRYVSSAGTAVAPYDDANTFPPGTRVLATRSFVANLPGTESLIYVETTANYTATGGRLQIGYGYQNGGCWMRWATSSNIYGSWQKFLMESGGNMEGQLGVLDQTSDNNSTRAANTAFVHGAMNFYGVAMGITDASASDRLTASGSPATNDFNLMVGQYGGGTYTLAGTYLNGPLGGSATYTGVMTITRRKYNAGAAVVMTVYQGSSAIGWVRVWNGTTWTAWEKQAFETSNVASATKLATARTITVGNTSKTFDGTGNISFSGAEIGTTGPNIAYNSDMLLLAANGRPLGWANNGGSSAGARTGSVSPYSVSGPVVRNMVSNTCASSNVGQYIEIATLTSDASYPVKPGVSYTLSVKARGTAGAEFRQYIQARDSTGATIYTQNSPVTPATGDWQQLEVTIPAAVIPANAVSFNFYLARLSRTATSPSAMTLDVAEPQFQEGLFSTPYQAAVLALTWGKGSQLYAGTDFNTVLADGDYLVMSALSGMTNTPGTTNWGKLRVTRAGTRIFQEYLTDGVPYNSWNRMSIDSGATWKAWVSTAADLSMGIANATTQTVLSSSGTSAVIPSATITAAGLHSAADKVKLDGIENNATKDWTGTAISTNGLDLNSFTGQGAYFCSANAVSATLLNNPTTKAFSLNVYAAAGIVQYLTEYASASNAANRMWVRGMYSNTWSAWQEVVTSLRPQTTTTTDPAGTNNTNIASTAFVQAATSGVLSLGGLTGGTRTLTAAECSNEVFALSGALTSNLIVQIPDGINRQWVVSNNTTGAFTVTLRSVTSGNTVVVPQGQRLMVFQNTPNVEEADTRIIPVARGGTGVTASTGTGSVVLSASPALTGNPTATTQVQQDNSTKLATTAFVKRDVYTPNDIIEQRRGLVGSGTWLQTWGWNTKKASFALEMTAAEEIQLISVDKETGSGLRFLARWDLAGAMTVPTYMKGRTVNSLWAPAVTQELNIGGAFASWGNDGGVPVIQVDAPDRNSAYMLWRTTRWGFAHLAAMHFHETAGPNQMVTMSMYGGAGTNQHRWYSNGSYECNGSVTANGVILTSDQRLKNIHGRITSALDTNRKLAKVMFSFKLTGGYTAGYIAQSVKKHAPWAVSERNAQPHEKELAGDKVLTVDYQALGVNTAAAVAELEVIVAQQRKELDELKALLREHLKA